MEKRHAWWVGLTLIVVALVTLRLALPDLARNYINDRLAAVGDYRGQVADVDIHLWRGAYAISGLEIVKTTGNVPVPFVRVDAIDFSVSWRALWQGAIVAEAAIFGPEINFVDAPQASDSQSGEGTDWRMAMQDMVPIDINRIEIVDGRIHFRNFTSRPPVDLEVSEINGVITNLSNADRSEGSRVASISAEGLMLNQAATELYASLDPLGDMRDFDLRLRVTAIDLTRLNTLTEAYGRFDFQSGAGDFVMELEASDGQLQGYAKPLLDNVEILDLEEDAEKGPLSAAWEALVAGAGWLFRNHPEDRLATQVEIRGNLVQQDISAWQAFVATLRNAFVEAYQANFERE
ncbi:DUF748 domain-containing protein [Modicisalibacter xianhensis]|uniref:DUF748 domain-containing protein n=1 Tax=Modicisalibacter xianhensis TaxID=442341 RepID=A0A1I3DVP8_9GAMM|nr:DUF748 domain-containing protein [Halomonas xianhensis]SFH90668.1 protein of unknown function [Halomonas xianhensis]